MSEKASYFNEREHHICLAVRWLTRYIQRTYTDDAQTAD